MNFSPPPALCSFCNPQSPSARVLPAPSGNDPISDATRMLRVSTVFHLDSWLDPAASDIMFVTVYQVGFAAHSHKLRTAVVRRCAGELFSTVRHVCMTAVHIQN